MNLVLYAESVKNLTDYVAIMEELIVELEAAVDAEDSNYESAQDCVASWVEAEKEFDGYMASIVGMGLSYESVESELLDYYGTKDNGSSFV